MKASTLGFMREPVFLIKNQGLCGAWLLFFFFRCLFASVVGGLWEGDGWKWRGRGHEGERALQTS